MSMFDQTAASGSPSNQPPPGPLVCVVEDEEEIRQNLCDLFVTASLPVRAFRSFSEFFEDEAHHGPCCLVIDPNLPGMGGGDFKAILIDDTDQIVCLTANADVAMCARAMKAGAVDFLMKPVDTEMLLEAAKRALARSQAILAAKIARSAAQAKFAKLTSREFGVMSRVITGLLNKQIAAELGIAEKTIKVHRGRVMRKTEVVSVAELVKLAIIAGITEPDKASVSY
jgi:FixJ family two-component response regulator